ncbi:glycoside hydrolase family 15 protein [Halalkalicoccus subterraneus]|uniref:glycoside hydrolase family 15 protein n=1 Tax=Halalkalicoccus subterraneus TaxID=2675002 RepID=UPI000EFB222E|nr:glycoside hydrolase family 15 protein [Halalkalicoccus subterraneus]
MQLRDALNDYKRHEGHDTRFPGERRSTTGLFSGFGGRLVHIERDGSLRDFGYPLTGRSGVDRSRLGLRVDGEIYWFDADDTVSQTYHDSTALVVTERETPFGALTQYDLTIDDAHVTHVELGEGSEADVELVAYMGFAPNAQDTRIGQLRHKDAVELYHMTEHDFVGSATDFSDLHGQVPIRFAEVLDNTTVDLPRPVSEDRYEEDRLSGDLVAFFLFESGRTSLVTLLTDKGTTTRETALDRLDELAAEYGDVAALRQTAEAETLDLPDDAPHADAVAADIRVLRLLSAETGLRIAGPDFDPYYAHSGGYGYTWFRDDAEISLFVNEVSDYAGLGLDAWTDRSARAYLAAQQSDGTWPHRVWPRDGTLAPGWANGRLEAGDAVDYQADQTGSVVTFLASVLDDLDGDLCDDVVAALDAALDGLDDTLAADGRPVACQNAWENMNGRFSHTTATFLGAYAAVADADLPAETTMHAKEQADRIYEAVDDLWVDDRGIYALRECETGELDLRYDSASLALVAAHRFYARVGNVDDKRLDRLVSHVEETVDNLWYDPDENDVRGLVRYEGDSWRQRGQGHEKVWTVSTAWGAHAAASMTGLLRQKGDKRAESFAMITDDLLSLVLPDGPLCMETGYLPEQVFDDGTPDSATPLGWPHALRLATVALTDELGIDVSAQAPTLAD